jgi:hypothetical protein
MKINIYALITVVCLFMLVSVAYTLDPSSPKKRPTQAITNIHVEKFSLKNPIRLYQTPKEKILTAKVRYVWHSSINKDPKSPQNIFDYKLFQINDEHMIVYKIDQSLSSFDENTVNSSHYLNTIKLENIDLLCNDKFFLCTLGEFKREFKKKMKHIDFTTAKEVLDSFPENIARDNCIIFTIGLFASLNDVGYLCFDEREDTIFFLDLISERILKRYKTDYEGQLRLVNQVKYYF